jgi:hypothetical protein
MASVRLLRRSVTWAKLGRMNKTHIAFSLVAVLAAASLSGCGSDSAGSATCGKVQPCGGSVVGSWKISSTCVTSAGVVGLMADFCPTGTVTPSFQVSGNITYNTNATYSGTFTESGTVTLGLPPSCLTDGATTFTCAQADAMFKASADPMAVSSVTCSGSGASCSCKFVMVPQTSTESGTYTTAGTTLTQTASTAGATADDNPYCVQGNELHIIDFDMSMPMGMMGQVTVLSDIVSIKQ